MACINLDGWDNVTSSLVVEKTRELGPAYGEWVEIYSHSESFKRDTHVGIVNEHEQISGVSHEFSLDFSLEQGYLFRGAGGTAGVNAGYRAAIETHVRDSFTSSFDETFETKCTLEDGEIGVSLY